MDKRKQICRKCLIRDIDKKQYFQNLYHYIEGLEDDIKADTNLYEERLSICKRCDFLIEGMCRTCGCFVELRAVIAKNNCPYKKW